MTSVYSLSAFLGLCRFLACQSNNMLPNPHRGDKYREATFGRIQDIAAINVIQRSQVKNSLACLSDCLSHPNCQSFNFQEKGDPYHICEFSESAIVSSPSCQESRPGYSFYFPFQNNDPNLPTSNCGFNGTSCKNGGQCLLGCLGNGCRCQEFNKGQYCEQWTTDISSCKDIFRKTRYRKNMAYTFMIDNKLTEIYCHLTNDTCQGGGWTLALKMNGTKTEQFDYQSALWSNKEAYNLTAGQTGFDNYQTKMPSYWAIPFDKVCVGFKLNDVLKWAVISYNAPSLYDVIAEGRFRSFAAASIGKAKWLSLLQGSKLQKNCDNEGFNLAIHTAWARIGIMANNENDCRTPDSVMGFGLNKKYTLTYSCGAHERLSNVKIAAQFGYLMIQ